MQETIIRVSGPVGQITLNRPSALHALNAQMCLDILDALSSWKNDDSIKLVVIDHAEETRGFCAGGDIKSMSISGQQDGEAARQFFEAEYRMNVMLFEYPKPVVSFIDGVTMGGGVGLTVHGSHAIATEKTLFAMPETGIGLFPDVGGSWFLSRLGAGLGQWLGLTGARLKGGDVAAAGIATHFVESKVLPAIKDMVMLGDLEILEAMEWEAYGSFVKHIDVITKCFDKETVEEVFAALEEEGGDWAQEQLIILKSKCPFSLKVTMRQLQEGLKHENFRETMAMEYRVANRLVRRSDFHEGVRAVVIDKDNAPQWVPDNLGDVSSSDVEAIFAPLEKGELTFL